MVFSYLRITQDSVWYVICAKEMPVGCICKSQRLSPTCTGTHPKPSAMWLWTWPVECVIESWGTHRSMQAHIPDWMALPFSHISFWVQG
jgi:hypothetical protein